MSDTNMLQLAATVLKSLPKREAARLMSKLEAKDLQRVIEKSNQLGDLDPGQSLTALNQLSIAAQPLRTEKECLVASSAPEIATEDSEARVENNSGPFRFLVHLPVEARHAFLADEHPENLALVIRYLPPHIASEVLRSLESPLQVSTVRRLCEVDDSSLPQAEQLAATLRHRLENQRVRKTCQDSVRLAANLLSGSEVKEEVLRYLAQLDRDLASELGQSLVRFEDLRDLEDLDFKVLLKNVDTSLWAPALKLASKQLCDKIFANLVVPVAKLLRRELDELEVFDRSECLVAQAKIIETLIRLNHDAKLDLPARAA